MKTSTTTITATLALSLAVACSPAGDDSALPASGSEDLLTPIEIDAAPGSLASQVTHTGEGVAITWLEPAPEDNDGNGQFRLRLAQLPTSALAGSGALTAVETTTVVERAHVFANWADLPGLVVLSDDRWRAFWLEGLGSSRYAYGVRTASSTDRGATWELSSWLHDDQSPQEHGFVSTVAGGAPVYWLDGRQMGDGGAMNLRRADLRSAGAEPPQSQLVDSRVCECCQTDAAMTADGPLVVYRDRSDQEIRDIYAALGDEPPRRVSYDEWQIPGCPVNGPAVAASDRTVVVAWFTGAEERARVRAAISSDSGRTFSDALLVDDRNPLGRVDLAIVGDHAWLVWLGRSLDGPALVMQALALGSELRLHGRRHRLVDTSAERASGFPRLVGLGEDRLVVTWTEVLDDRETKVRAGLVNLPPSSES